MVDATEPQRVIPFPRPPEQLEALDALLLRSLLEESADRVYFKDLDSRFLRVSRSQAAMVRPLPRSEVVGASRRRLLRRRARAAGRRRRAGDHPYRRRHDQRHRARDLAGPARHLRHDDQAAAARLDRRDHRHLGHLAQRHGAGARRAAARRAQRQARAGAAGAADRARRLARRHDALRPASCATSTSTPPPQTTLGLSSDEVLGRTSVEIGHPQDAETLGALAAPGLPDRRRRRARVRRQRRRPGPLVPGPHGAREAGGRHRHRRAGGGARLHRPQAGRGRARLPGRPRPADRAGEPGALPRPGGPRAAAASSATVACSACSSSTSTGSRPSTTPSATLPATGSCCRWASGCRRPPAGRTPSSRFGGDEFVVLCEGLVDDEDIRSIADRISRALSEPLVYRGQSLPVSASIGIVTCAAADANAERLVADADAAMYQAKHQGGNRHEFFDAGLRDRALARTGLMLELHRALERGEFRLHYQPVLRLADQSIVGVEALIRWQHPTRGPAPARRLPRRRRAVELHGRARGLGPRRRLRAARRVVEPAGPHADQHGGQRLGSAVRQPRLRRRRRGHDRPPRDRPVPPLPRDHRDRAARGVRRRAGDLRRPGQARRPARPRRLRYGLLLARPPAQVPRTHPQGRPVLRQRARRRPRATWSSSAPSPPWRARSASPRWPRASRRRSSWTCWAPWAATTARATCSPGRWRPSGSRRSSTPSPTYDDDASLIPMARFA